MDSLKLTMHPLYIHIILMWVTLRMVENVIPHCTKYILILTDKVNMLDEKEIDIYLLKQDVDECLFLMNELTKMVRRHWLS